VQIDIMSQRPKSAWKRQLRYHYLRLKRLQSSPHAIARGIAAGVFAGWFPIFGFQTLAAVLLAMPLRGNKIAAALATWVSNPLTYVPIYLFNFFVGQHLLGSSLSSDTLLAAIQAQDTWLAFGKDLLMATLLGSACVGLIVASISYFLGLWLVQRWRHRPSSIL
jgi:hypothetical protein